MTTPRKPTLLDRIAGQIARVHARRIYRRFLAATRKGPAAQRGVLLDKIRRNTDSDFGREHRFDTITSVDDFRRRVPIRDYDGHLPYLRRVLAGDLRALFGAGQPVLMFAMSSGTAGEPKHIPITPAFLDEYRRGWNAFGIKALLDHPDAFLRGILQVSSRMDETRTATGVPCGAITGLMAATQKRLVQKYYIAPSCLAEIDDPAAKYYTIMRMAVPVDAAFAITASPATQLKLARTADLEAQALIRDVRDGTLRRDLNIPDHVRGALRPRLQPSPAAAARLEGLVHAHGRLLPKHYWRLSFLANWTAGTMSLYLRDFPEYFGDVPVRDVGLLASEGRVSLCLHDGDPAGVLDITSHFFEFMPADERGRESPRTLLPHELAVGQECYVLMTTSSGLYRYDLGDLVRVRGFEGQVPLIEFLSKGSHIASLAGEKLTERQVVLAMEELAKQDAGAPENFVLAACWGQPPGYTLHVDASVAIRGNLADLLDHQLQQLNLEYANRRATQRLQPIRLNRLPPGFLADLDAREAARHRRGNEQYKHRYLYAQPGHDADWPTTSQPHDPSARFRE